MECERIPGIKTDGVALEAVDVSPDDQTSEADGGAPGLSYEPFPSPLGPAAPLTPKEVKALLKLGAVETPDGDALILGEAYKKLFDFRIWRDARGLTSTVKMAGRNVCPETGEMLASRLFTAQIGLNDGDLTMTVEPVEKDLQFDLTMHFLPYILKARLMRLAGEIDENREFASLFEWRKLPDFDRALHWKRDPLPEKSGDFGAAAIVIFVTILLAIIIGAVSKLHR